jgi:hypothetical protein
MPVSSDVYAVFRYFENLNLLTLLQDLREGRTARQAWISGSFMCPIAHGMPHGDEVRELKALGQAADLPQGCQMAARYLGTDPRTVLFFVRCWDEEMIDSDCLLRRLEEIWQERMHDAEAMQLLLQAGSNRPQAINQEFEECSEAQTRIDAEPTAVTVSGGNTTVAGSLT